MCHFVPVGRIALLFVLIAARPSDRLIAQGRSSQPAVNGSTAAPAHRLCRRRIDISNRAKSTAELADREGRTPHKSWSRVRRFPLSTIFCASQLRFGPAERLIKREVPGRDGRPTML